MLISFYSGIQTHPAICRDMPLPAVNVQQKKPVSHQVVFLLLLLSLYFPLPHGCKLTHMLGDITSFPRRQVAEATGPCDACGGGDELVQDGFADCHPGRF